MTTISKLRAGTSRVLDLPNLTNELREAAQIGPAETVRVRIRRVRASEVLAITGATPLLFSLALEREKGESDEEFNRRLQERLVDDPAAILDAQRQTLAQQNAVVRLGASHIAITGEGEEPAWERLELTEDGEQTVDLLGSDLATVHDAIVEYSSLPYQRLGGAGTAAFPEEPAGAGGEPGGGLLRDDAQPVPEPPAG